MHELMRQYCEERLNREHEALSGETLAAVYDRFGVYLSAFMREQISRINFQREASGALVAELGNLQAVWDWVVRHGTVEAGVDLVVSLYFLAEMLGWLHPVLQILATARPRLTVQLQPGLDAERRYIAGAMLGWLEWSSASLYRRLGLLQQAQSSLDNLARLIEQGVTSADMPQLFAQIAGLQAFYQGRWSEARRLHAALLHAVTMQPTDYTVMGSEKGPAFWAAHSHAFLA